MYELAYRCKNCDAIFKEELSNLEIREKMTWRNMDKDREPETSDKDILEDIGLLSTLFMWGKEIHWCGPKTVSYGDIIAVTKLED